MKKITLLTALFLFAQLATAQVNFGARLGMNLGMFELTNDNVEGDYDISQSLSIIIQMDVDVPFSTVFSFRTGLGLVIKGAEVDNLPSSKGPSNPNGWGHADTNYSLLYRINYLELPLLLVGRLETDFFGNFFLGVGPTLSLGVGGRMELFADHRDPNNKGQHQKTLDLEWGSKPSPEGHHGYNYLRRFDVGLGAVFAYQLPRSGLTFTASYNRGLRNISPNEGVNLKTSYFGFSVGFMMGG